MAGMYMYKKTPGVPCALAPMYINLSSVPCAMAPCTLTRSGHVTALDKRPSCLPFFENFHAMLEITTSHGSAAWSHSLGVPNKRRLQWLIQDFSEGGGFPEGGAPNYYFAGNCMKINFDRRGEGTRIPGAPRIRNWIGRSPMATRCHSWVFSRMSCM